MNLNKSTIIYLFSLLLISACGQDQAQQTEAQDDEVAVSTMEVSEKSLPVVLKASGNIQAWEKVLISGQAGTRIQQILAEVGDQVRKGETLVRMSDERLQQAQSQLDLTRKDLQRLDTLLEIGSVSQQRYDQAETQYQNALNEFQSLKQNVELTSPLNGVVSQKYFYEGELFSPSGQSPSILTVVEINPVKLLINLSEDYYSRIEKGMSAEVSVDNYPDQNFEGVVHKKYPTIDEATRTFEVEIRIGNDEDLLRPGMYAETTIPLEEQSGIYIPASAIVRQPATSREYVFMIKADTVLRKRVETGNQIQDQVLVTEGLAIGQEIITEGLAKVETGDRVRIIN